MTGETVTFDMTGDATLQRLSCRLPVAKVELSIAIVITGRTDQRTPSGEAALLVAALAELAGVVTVVARA